MVKAYETIEIDTIGGKRFVTNEFYLPYHTQRCHAVQTRLMEQRERFLLEFPNACKVCRCYGFEASYDWYSGATEGVPCSDCADEGLCPLCGDSNFGLDDDYERCSVCNWSYDTGPFMPDPDGCDGCGSGAMRYG